MSKLWRTCLLMMLCALPMAAAAQGMDADLILNGQSFTLPIAMGDLTEAGWTTEQAEQLLPPDAFTVSETFSREGQTFHGSVINLSINEMPEGNCFLGQITVTAEDAATGVVLTYRGLTIGATRDAVLETCGTPTAIDTSGELPMLVYTGENYDKASFTFGGDTVTAISLRRFTAPAGYSDQATVDAALPPDDCYVYEAPDGLGHTLTAGRIQLGDQAYQLPVPFSVLAADGWQLDVVDQVVPSKDDLGGALLQRDGQQVTAVLYNDAPVATVAGNCLVEEVTVTGGAGVLPGGIAVGTEQSMLEEQLTAYEYTAEETEGGVTYRIDFGMDQAIVLQVDGVSGRVAALAVICLTEDE